MPNKNDFCLFIKNTREIKTSYMKKGSRCTHSPKRPGMGFVCFLSGELEYKFFDGTTYIFKEGDIVFFKETPYIAYINKDTTHLVMNFDIDRDASFGDVVCELFDNPKPFIIDKKKYGKYKSIMEKAVNVSKKNHFGIQMLQLPLCYDIMYDVLFSLLLDNVNKDTYNQILPAKVYIDENYTKNISVAYLSNMCNMSETNFRGKFSSVFGVPPSEYINTVKISNAKNYFATGAYSVTEVARLCGFGDTNYFCRFFKKQTGITPMKYKMSVS